MQYLLELLNKEHRDQLKARDRNDLEELRFCVGQPLTVRWTGREEQFWPVITQRELEETVQSACRQSVYAFVETLRQGYVTIAGGHRVGICGVGVLQNGAVQMVRNVSSIVIRVARQVEGCADNLVMQISKSCLIFGSPCSGKTTLLRDLVRQMSDRRKFRMGVVDERGELSGGLLGVPQLKLGSRTDVMINVPKATAAMMLLRTMNPQWIAMDEITSPEDIAAMDQISYCGVRLLATAHGNSMEDLYSRPLYRSLMDKKIFETVILLNVDKTYQIVEVDK